MCVCVRVHACVCVRAQSDEESIDFFLTGFRTITRIGCTIGGGGR